MIASFGRRGTGLPNSPSPAREDVSTDAGKLLALRDTALDTSESVTHARAPRHARLAAPHVGDRLSGARQLGDRTTGL